MTDHYEGTCDVCGTAVSLDHDPSGGRVIDIAAEPDGRVYTWVRHYTSAPPGADPNCEVYSSRVWLSGS